MMKNVVNNCIERFKREKQARRRFISIITVLALVVSCGVFWQLSEDGVAMANETYCGLEEHTHTEECYEKVLTCGLEEGEATEGHTHDESCYETVTTLVCGLEESEGHTHGDECYDEEGNIVCGLEESAGHTHSDECYETTQTLICGLEESEGTEGHTHTEDCYGEEQLICDIPEHTHTIACMSDETADVETALDWEKTLPEELTGVWAEDVVAIAQSQLGYTESTRNFTVSEDDGKQKGYTRYGAWYGDPYGDWCAMFASFCLHYAGVPEYKFPEAEGCWAWTIELSSLGLYEDVETSDYVPVPGDLIFFNRISDNDKDIDHVGIVEEVKYQTGEDGEEVPVSLVTIEGNSSSMVKRNTYDINDSCIVGYGALPEQEGLEEWPVTLTYEGPDYIVTVTYDEDAELPKETELTVSEYEKDSEIYLARYAEAAELYGWEDDADADAEEEADIDADAEAVEDETDSDDGDADRVNDVRLFNIGLTAPNEDGEMEELEPAASVEVTITYLTPAEQELRYSVAHFGEETEDLNIDVTEEESGAQALTFEVEGFSDFMVLAWSESGKGKVVINLGNGNGKYNNADYTHDRQAGTLLRYTTDSLEDYAVDGEVTINLPADSNLNSTFTVVDATGSLSAVTIDLGSDLAYDYQLVGWVNIATGEYYDVSNGPATATVDLDNDNVFYADWIAATYDHGSQTDANLRDDIVSTSGFVTIHMYDYNDLFNLYSESLVQNEEEDGTLWEAWTDSGNLYNELPYPSGNRLTSSFIFVNNGTVGYSNQSGSQEASTGGMLTWPNYKTAGDTWTGSGAAPRDATEIWGITSPYSAPMNMLFDPESSALGVHYVGEADYLFWIDDNGYYTYNSKEAAATYNQTDQCFYVYNGVQNVTNTSFSCFLPYNTYGESLNAVNGTVNYFFGMDMEVNFYLPNATGTTGGNQVNGEDMVFNFSGDDDILIFVDDQLVLDMSGIHDEAFGSINFSDGTVKMAMTEAGLDSAEPTSLSLSSGTHDLKVYYMERGGYASNLEIQFNVVSLWEYESGEVQTITAEKNWVDTQGNEIDPEDLPDVYKNNGVEVGLFDVVGPASDGTLGYTQSGDTYTVVYTDDSGVTRTYVYDASGPTLTYTEVSGDGTTIGPETDDQTDSEGRVVDKDGYVVAWLDGRSLYIRIDKQTLNNENGWYYAWELMDPEGTYEVLELSNSSSYTTTSERENLLRYNYWSIIGDSEIEYSFETGETLAVILTEAAQEASNTLGDTKDAMGWVIVATENGITTEQIEFSQIAELLELEDDNGNTYYETIAGVTSQSQVDSLGSGAIWYVVDAESQNTDATGYTEEDFHLYCYLGGTQYYLNLNGNSLGITSDASAAGTFCYDSLGELLVILGDGSTARVEIQADGTITIGAAEFEAERDDIRIYTLQEVETSGFSFTATNVLMPDFTLEKVDSTTGTPLAGVAFTLQNEDDLYYIYDESTEEVNWSEDEATILTGESGTYLFHYLADGAYTLTETQPASVDGVTYSELPSSITITISGGVIISATWAGNVDSLYNTFIYVSDDGLTITVENQIEGGPELPQTGGAGTILFTLIGLILIGGAGWLLYRRRRITY